MYEINMRQEILCNNYILDFAKECSLYIAVQY
jgi:hypothetical protein